MRTKKTSKTIRPLIAPAKNVAKTVCNKNQGGFCCTTPGNLLGIGSTGGFFVDLLFHPSHSQGKGAMKLHKKIWTTMTSLEIKQFIRCVNNMDSWPDAATDERGYVGLEGKTKATKLWIEDHVEGADPRYTCRSGVLYADGKRVPDGVVCRWYDITPARVAKAQSLKIYNRAASSIQAALDRFPRKLYRNEEEARRADATRRGY